MFVTRSIDEFFCRISTQEIIIVVEGRACDKNIEYFKEPGQKCTEAEYCMPSC